eukprot:TRINITY_DN4375_c0_g1_i6.p1 TRINITY_DN4375_c0_g1~~TRINITY_DN4375_c0_g1_i6.p1  ORF type:complete len:219 (-),score=12.14 TRINITY_DN4375_c0_g1_i6:115-771(-)
MKSYLTQSTERVKLKYTPRDFSVNRNGSIERIQTELSKEMKLTIKGLSKTQKNIHFETEGQRQESRDFFFKDPSSRKDSLRNYFYLKPPTIKIETPLAKSGITLDLSREKKHERFRTFGLLNDKQSIFRSKEQLKLKLQKSQVKLNTSTQQLNYLQSAVDLKKGASLEQTQSRLSRIAEQESPLLIRRFNVLRSKYLKEKIATLQERAADSKEDCKLQ